MTKPQPKPVTPPQGSPVEPGVPSRPVTVAEIMKQLMTDTDEAIDLERELRTNFCECVIHLLHEIKSGEADTEERLLGLAQIVRGMLNHLKEKLRDDIHGGLCDLHDALQRSTNEGKT